MVNGYRTRTASRILRMNAQLRMQMNSQIHHEDESANAWYIKCGKLG